MDSTTLNQFTTILVNGASGLFLGSIAGGALAMVIGAAIGMLIGILLNVNDALRRQLAAEREG